MPMQERVQLTRALADKHGRKLDAVKDWLPLLRFTQGNPLTITVIAGQALRDGIATPEQIEAYLNKLHTGEKAFDDEAGEGRSKSLGASLSYGFEQAFNADERKVLALLHFFQGFVDVDALKAMGHPDADWCLPEIRGLTRETGIAILDKASDIGLLTAHGNGYYTIHPALPWFFRALFEQHYPNEVPPADQRATDNWLLNTDYWHATRAFVKSLGELGNYYHDQYGDGNRDVIASLRMEEPNLLHARSLARQHGWWDAIIKSMQGLDTLYTHTGRRAEWKRLVEEIVPDFVGADDLPLAGREEQWAFIIQWRMQLAREGRNLAKAERLQRIQVDEQRRNAASLLTRPAESLSAREKNTLRTLAVSVEQLGHIQRDQGKPECADAYKESIPLYQQIDDKPAEAVLVFNLGHAYANLPALRNLDEAERWYRRSLELNVEGDRQGNAGCYSQLGLIEYEKFNEAQKAKQPDEQLLKYLNAAVKWYHLALENDSPDNPADLATDHNALGVLYMKAGDMERALYHYNQGIHFTEVSGNLYEAGRYRRNLAIALANQGRLSDALLYARAALRNFETYQGRAKEMEDEAKGLIEAIEEQMSREQ